MVGKTATLTGKVRINNDVLIVTIPKKTCIELGILPGDLVMLKIAKGQAPDGF